MPAVVPRRIATCATRGALTSFTLQLAIAASWAAGLLPGHPNLGVMLTLTVGTATAVLGTAAVVCRGQLAIAQAFAAGVQVGRAIPPDRAARSGLRVVD